MTQTIEAANAAVRQAVEHRLEAQVNGAPQSEWYKAMRAKGGPTAQDVIERFGVTESLPESERAEVPQQRTFYPSTDELPAVRTLHESIAAVRDRHGKYGPPSEHFARTAALVNAAFGTTFTASDWALVMVLDKVARQVGPGSETDDAAVDIAGYAACHQECRKR